MVDLWRQGDWKTFCAMLPEYADLCVGEGGMHDTAMLLGLLGWDAYDLSLIHIWAARARSARWPRCR